MANFDSGVYGYVYAEATVQVAFPVDKNGACDINCHQCWFFRRSYQTCGLNGAVCQYPQKYVGDQCPLKLAEQIEPNNNNKTEETNNESN